MTVAERIIYFELNKNKCSARIPLEYPVGDITELRISVEDMHFFNKETGEVIKYEKEV